MAYAPCGSQHKDAVQVTLEQMDLIKRFVSQYPNHLRFVNDSTGKNDLLFYGSKLLVIPKYFQVEKEKLCSMYIPFTRKTSMYLPT